MFTAEFSETKKIWIQLRWDANYWQRQHTRAIEREAVWKTKIKELELSLRSQDAQTKEIIRQFTTTIDAQNVHIAKLNQQLEELKSHNAWLKQRIFGRQTEQSKHSENDIVQKDSLSSFADSAENREKLSRGQQKGAPGHGRKHREHLPSIEVFHDVDEHEKYCPICGLPFSPLSITQDSQDIHYEVRLIRRIHKRRCYAPTCHCGAVPGMVTAPPPAKLIPKGLFSTDFWVHILTEKFLFQRPMSRILQTLTMEGLYLSQGTITGGLEKIKDMVYPLYTRILEKSRSANHWHMDETRWMMFVIVKGKTNHRWWLWVVVTQDTVVYILDHSRSANVPKNHLGQNPHGIISADRYSVYKSLCSENLQIAFCWCHVRRDYVRIHDAHENLRPWAKVWIDSINELFHLNNNRLKVISDKDAFQSADHILRKALDSFKEMYINELKSDNLHPLASKALTSLANHWSGLLIFVDHPEIPMDNNISERDRKSVV